MGMSRNIEEENSRFVYRMMSEPVEQKVELQLDGSVCRVIPELAPMFMSVERQFRADNLAFHNRLMSLGVKAYRSNDGWVDRKRHIITLFVNCDAEGWHYAGSQYNTISTGDLIAIGDAHDGAMVIKVVKCEKPYRDTLLIYYGNEVLSVVDGVRDGKDVKSKYHAPWQSKLLLKLGIIEPYKYPIHEDN